jgi:S-DNA-T family DNA segregation ATPase FtsK/SpoIIIE
MSGGGFLGGILFSLSRTYLKNYGTILVLAFASIFSIQVCLGFSWTSIAKRSRAKFLDIWYKHLERKTRKRKTSASRPCEHKSTPLKTVSKQAVHIAADCRETPDVAATPTPRAPSSSNESDGELPGLELLTPVPDSQPRIPQTQLDDLARRLKECLADFSIQGEVQRIQPGPVITMLEFKPAPGVKISKISGLGNDLSLALKAMAVRIVAPLPGKDTVGIEIPNQERQTVYLQEILSSPVFTKTKAKIPLALGKDIQGQPRQADLATMPHLLVAGATGAGKSVCLNTLILSILYKSGPEEVKLLLVDPKRIELAVYGSLPHLVHPVVTDMSLAKNALEWAVYEMEQRYESMAKVGVRNIAGYNQKLASMGKVRPEELQDLTPYPYLVVIVDELADLMLTAGKEVEVSIVRLAQLARAAGIHLILATQRPSVDVVTGLIKANFPSRIAFQVSSKHDSRTILDGVGAEYLLGQGDMLFKKSGGNLTRIHGAFVDDDEINAVVAFWAAKGKQEFDLDFASWKQEQDSFEGPGGSGNDIADDPKYGEAVAFVMDHGKASISLIQRRLRIGFNKAARFIEQMEQDGIIGPQEGSKPRSVIKK